MNIHERIKFALSEIVQPNTNVKVEFEGPFLSIYTNDISLVTGETGKTTKLAKFVRKKVLIRPLPEIRLDKEKAKEIIKQTVPKNAELDEKFIIFNDHTGEIHLYALRPSLIRGERNVKLYELIKKIGWKIILHRRSPIESEIMKKVDYFVSSNLKDIYNTNLRIGMKINRESIKGVNLVRITSLGGAKEVGRSSFLVSSDEINILIDAGLKPGARRLGDEFPLFYIIDDVIDKLDAVVISHAHFDHCASLPYLFKYGYRGPVYAHHATKYLMTLIISDYLNILQKEGKSLPYTYSDLMTAIAHTITLDYGEVIDIAPNTKLTLYNAGHILGSSIVHLHFGEGYHNLVYTGDFKFGKTRLLDPSFYSFKRNETLIMESTYGGEEDVMASRAESVNFLINIIRNTLEKGGKVLMPMLAVGRAQEILLTIFEGMESNQIPKVPVFVEGMIHETTAIHISFLEYLSQEIKEKVFKEGMNPFTSEYFRLLKDNMDRKEVVESGPAIIIATSGMLTGGPALEYFKLLANDERNALIFTSFQVQNTLGRKIKDGAKEVYIPSEKGEELIKVNLQVYSAEGFSGHSDRNQLLNYIRFMPNKPKKIILCHGESNKISSLAKALRREYQIEVLAPSVGETIRLK